MALRRSPSGTKSCGLAAPRPAMPRHAAPRLVGHREPATDGAYVGDQCGASGLAYTLPSPHISLQDCGY